jgi:peroxiredoxin
VYAVSFEQPGRLRAYIRANQIALPVLSDPQRRVYRAYGLARGPLWRIYGPRVLWGYATRILRGARPHVRGDTLQQGGDFVIDPSGRLCLAHVGQDSFDRPSVEELLRVVRDAARSSQ